MREAKLLETRDVHPTEIETSQRLRPASEAAIETIIASVEQLGLIKDEIIVRKVKHRGGKLVLVAGLHRLEACRRMDWMVPAKIFDCTDDWAQLMEVDDNLAGAELGALDSAIFLATRKRIYESLHPEAKHGGDRRSADFQVDFVSVRSFAAVTAEKFGLTERHVRRLVSAGEKLATPEINDLRRAPRPITLKDLQEFAKIGNAAERYDVARALGDGEAKSAAEARRAWSVANSGSAPPITDPVEATFRDLLTRWRRATKEARRRFVRAAYEEGLPVLFEEAHDILGDEERDRP